MKALILAAGKGTRLKELTRNCPKPMLPIGDLPLLGHHLLWLRRHGIREIAINLHHAPEVVTDYFGDGHEFGVSLHYSHEETLLGTAGAAKRVQGFLNQPADQPFVLIYGDVFTNLNLQRLVHFHQTQVHQAHLTQTPKPAMTLALYQVPNPTECGLVELDQAGQIVRFTEKPPAHQVFTRLANAGIMVCEASVLDAIPPETVFDFGLDLFPMYLGAQKSPFGQRRDQLWGQEVQEDEYVIDIGTPNGYQRAQEVYMRSASSLLTTLHGQPESNLFNEGIL
ncbi:MAG: nucleotidyltransferase family protein [Caldilineaceae bacterium]|nr:nucleotidyltransferase family protein [Caldilineaceae bacterium]